MTRVFARLAPAALAVHVLFAVGGYAAPREETDENSLRAPAVTMQYAKIGDAPGVVLKDVALSLELDGKPPGVASFDPLLCRWAGAWTAPSGDQPERKGNGTPGGSGGATIERSSSPTRGPLVFETSSRAGWLGPEGVLTGSRHDPGAPLPEEWARWIGLRVSGGRVALGYTVQGTLVEEVAALKRKNGIEWFERTLEVGPSKKPLTFVVCDAKSPAPSLREDVGEFLDGEMATMVLWDSPRGEDLILSWQLVEGAICLEIPPLTQAAHFAVRTWRGSAKDEPDRGAWEEAAGAHAPIPDFFPIVGEGLIERVIGAHVERGALQLAFDAAPDFAAVSDPRNFEARLGVDQRRGPLEITSAMVSPDGKSVALAVPGIRPAMGGTVSARLKTALGTRSPIEICHWIRFAPAAAR